MTSEIKVDTISEQTSANGVTIDGLTIKDGNIQGSPALVGTTPSFTIGDGGAEDTKIVFDGNALDYYIGLDDSADNLIIGSGSTVGSNSLITIDSDGDTTFDIVGGITLDADDEGTISFKDGGSRYGLVKKASDNFEIQSMLSDGDIVFKGNDNGATITALTLDMSDAGTATFNHDILLGDSGEIKFGASGDLRIYHDGSDSYFRDVGTGALYIEGETSVNIRSNSTSEKMAVFNSNGSAELYYDNTLKFLTSSTGINLPVDGDSIKFGANSEVLLTHVHNAGLTLGGTTPTFTIGDGGAEDTKIVFDGNAVDFVVGLDDSADEFRIGVGSGLGSDRVFEINSSGVSTFQKAVHFAGSTPTVTVGDGGAEDAKILFDGNAHNFHIGLDDSTDKLTIGLGNALGTYPGFTMDENTNVEFPDNSVTIISSGNNDNLTLKTTDTDANIGPNLRLYRAVAGAASDAIGTIDWAGQDAGGGLTDYASAAVTITDATDGSEDATLTLKVMNAGALNQMLTISGPETVVNEGSKDHDFRVESNGNANTFFVDGGTDRVAVGTNAPAQTMHIRSTGNPSNDTGLILEGGATDANCALYFYNSAGSERGRLLYDTDDNNLQFKVNTTEHFRIAANGDLTATDTSIGSNSDSRLKENIADYTYDISKFKQFKAKTFDWKNPTQHNNGTGNRGFIAQEVAAIDDYWTDQISIDPDTEDAKLIDADSDGNHMAKTLKLGKKDAMYISVIQQLITRIEALEG
jgi:hypothetical protein